jgi:integrase
MATRRGAGEGTVYRRNDGLWLGQVRLSTGRRTFAAKSRSAVLGKIAEAVKLDRQGIPVPGAGLTVTRFLDDWLQDRKDKMRQTAYESCERHVRLHIKPPLGTRPLIKLTRQDVRKMEAAMLKAGKAAQTVRNVHGTLHRALDDAVKWDLVLRNVADLVDPPKAEHREIVTLTAEEGRRLLAAAASDRFEALFVLALTAGLRRGELLGLTWADVDLDSAALTVRREVVAVKGGLIVQEPKTDRSRRPLDLDALALAALRRRRKAAESAGAAAPDAYLFCTTARTPLNPSNLWSRHWQPLLRRAGIEATRLDDLRHTNATMMLTSNVHPKVASERLGHSSIRLTLDTYSHVVPGMGRAAADAVARLLSPPSTDAGSGGQERPAGGNRRARVHLDRPPTPLSA